MVVVQSISLDTDDRMASVGLFADTKGEVTDDIEVKGVPSGYTIAPGSSVITSAGEMAFRKSDGTWNWV